MRRGFGRGAVVTAALAALLPVGVGTAATAATATADAGTRDVAPNGRIAFADRPAGSDHYDVFVVEPDGTGLTNVTNTEDLSESDPTWSPDGLRLAFNRGGPGDEDESDIWVMDADGTDPAAVTDTPEPDFQPDWSPDGARLVFTRMVEGETITSQPDIFVIDADGTDEVNITAADTSEYDPAWSPDGDRIVFAGARQSDTEYNRWELITVDPDGTDPAFVTTAGGESYEDRSPDWDPTGEMIVFMSQYDESCCGDWDVWAVNEDGTGRTNLTDDGDPWLGYGDWFPAWSPDGTQITFSSNRATGWSFDVYAMAAPTVLPPPAATASAAASSAPSAGGFPTSDDGARRVTRGAGSASGLSWGRATGPSIAVALQGTGRGRVTSNDGGIACGTDCTQSYRSARSVRLRARPAAGSVFVGWGGACAGTAPECTLTVGDAVRVVARFKPAPAG